MLQKMPCNVTYIQLSGKSRISRRASASLQGRVPTPDMATFCKIYQNEGIGTLRKGLSIPPGSANATSGIFLTIHICMLQMMAHYVKAMYDFNTSEAGEIALRVGDIVRVVKQIDANWLQGETHGKVGSFPSNFVTELALPPVSNGQKIFQAVRSFPAEVQGDLGVSER